MLGARCWVLVLGASVVIGVSCLGVLAIGIVPGPLVDLARDAVPVLVGG